MSYQKKSIILQQIQQAIRKKAQQKSRNKQQVNRALLGSIQKKKQVLKVTNKQLKMGSTHKEYERSDKMIEKHISLFNNEQLNTMDANDLKLKKYNNRRLDKLVSLIQYMVSSSEKVIKYISSTNFEAEFALKLYRSDKENLLNQLKNLSIDDLIESFGNQEKQSKADQSYNMLLDENNKLKKEILILEKQAERFHKGASQERENYEGKIIQKECSKLKEMIRKLVPFERYKQIMQILQKEGKFQIMYLKCQESSKKIAEIEVVINSLENERGSIIEGFTKRGDQKSERTYRFNQIQGEKEQLQKEIGVLKNKITELKESSMVIAEFQLLKKNSELMNEKCLSLARSLSDGSLSPTKKSNEMLIDFIKIKVNELVNRSEDALSELQSLRGENEELRMLRQEKQDQFVSLEEKMNSLMNDVDNLKDLIDEAKAEKEEMIGKLKDSQNLLRNRQEEINILSEKVRVAEQKEDDKQEIRSKNNQLRKEIQSLTRKIQQQEKEYTECIVELKLQKQQLEEKIIQISQQTAEQKIYMMELQQQRENREDSKQLVLEKAKIQSNLVRQQFKRKNEELEEQLLEQREKYQKILHNYEESNQYYKILTDSYNEKHQKLKQIQGIVSQMQEKIDSLLEEKAKMQQQANQNIDQRGTKEKQLQFQNQNLYKENERVRKENTILDQKLRVIQQQTIKNNYSLQEMTNIKNQNLKVKAQIIELKKDIEQAERRADELLNTNDALSEALGDLNVQIKQLKQDISFANDEKQSLQHIIRQHSDRHQQQSAVMREKLQSVQMKNIDLNRQKREYQEMLNMEKDNSQTLNQKIKHLQDQIKQLKSEMRSLTIISNEFAEEKYHQKGMVSSLQQQKCKLQQQKNQIQNQLVNTKQQIQQQSQINRHRTKQYAYLLKQILKGISLQPADYDHLTSFEELLEFGSKQVVVMRKKLRQQQSNKRRINRKGDSYSNESENLQDIKTQLFRDGSNQKNEQIGTKVLHQQQEVDIDQFQEMKSNKANDSMISQDNKFNLQNFNDLQEQEMNSSMISNEVQHNKETEEKKAQMAYKPKIIEDVKYFENNGSELSNIPEIQKKSLSPSSSQMKQIFAPQASSAETVNAIKPLEEYEQVKSENESIKSEKQLQKQEQKKSENSSQVVIYPISKFNVQQIVNLKPQESDSVDIDQFSQMKEGDMGNSMLSQKPHNISEFNDIQDANNDSVLSVKQQQYAIENFKQIQGEDLGRSMLSEKEHGISEFGEMNEQPMNDSMLSHQIKGGQQQEHGFDEFGEMKEEPMNDSMLSQDKKEEQHQHGLSEFGDMKEQPMNDSILSQKKEGEHGLSEFGQLEEQVNDSILSERQKGSPRSEGNNLDDFEEVKSDRLNESLVSEPESKPESP